MNILLLVIGTLICGYVLFRYSRREHAIKTMPRPPVSAPSMSPAHAADVLGIPPTADAAEVIAAHRAQMAMLNGDQAERAHALHAAKLALLKHLQQRGGAV